ncbi:radical SAM protein [Candidatus Gracilibacteria bacterium]|nr:radical SAM protein [Candidatus Gracilibacteria bacterium]
MDNSQGIETLRLLANIGYYEDQYPNILSCNEDISYSTIVEKYFHEQSLFPLKASRVGLYVHIPFCKTQCLYCDCTVLVEERESIWSAYLDVLQEEAAAQYRSFGAKIPIETCYIGGGTPSVLSVDHLKRLDEILRKYYDFSNVIQYTFECSPYTTDAEKLDFIADMGVNRITFGVQSLDETILKLYNRPQEKEETLDIILQARKKFPYVNIDIIAGLPGQSLKSFVFTMKTISKYIRPTTMVVHPFQPTLRTPFARMQRPYTQSDIAIRKVMRKLAEKFTLPIERSPEFNRAKNQQLYDISYSYKSVIGLGFGAITTIPGSVKYHFESFETYMQGKTNNDIHVKACTMDQKDLGAAYFLRCIISQGVDFREYSRIFDESIEQNIFYQRIFSEKLEEYFTINDNSISFSRNLSKIEKRNLLLHYFGRYPILVPKKYEGSPLYSDLDIFFDY